MPGIPVARADSRADACPPVVLHRPELRHAGGSIRDRVDRFHLRTSTLSVAAVEVLYLHLLDMRRVRQHDRAKVDGGKCCVDRAAEAEPHHFGKEAAVIDMGMGEDDRIDRLWAEREVAVVKLLLGFRALEKAAVDEDPGMAGFEFVARARDSVGGTVKAQDRVHGLLPGHPTQAGADCSALGHLLQLVRKHGWLCEPLCHPPRTPIGSVRSCVPGWHRSIFRLVSV